MTKAPRILSTKQAKAALTDSRAKALAGMTKPELVKTIKTLDSRVTKLLNQVAFEKEKWEASQAVAVALQRELSGRQPELISVVRETDDAPYRMPWEQD